MKVVTAKLVEGHKVASGKSETDKRFPEGTIKMQQPFFKERGLDFEVYFDKGFVSGTLNLSIAPKTFSIKQPEYFFPEVKWTDVFPPENFFLSKAEVIFEGRPYKALIYIPDPSTKPDHFKEPSIIEIIAEKIEGLEYGNFLELRYNPGAIMVNEK